MTKHRILLVEDDRDRITLTRHALRDHDLDVEIDVTCNSDDALSKLREAPDELLPDLVLLDLKLEGSSGFDVLEAIRTDARLAELPVVVLTSSREAADRRASYQLGANSYVTKPVDYEDFRDRLQTIGDYWLEINEPPASPT